MAPRARHQQRNGVRLFNTAECSLLADNHGDYRAAFLAQIARMVQHNRRNAQKSKSRHPSAKRDMLLSYPMFNLTSFRLSPKQALLIREPTFQK